MTTRQLIAASISALTIYLAGMAAAFACSPARPQIYDVLPNDGATIAPGAAFSVSHLGDLDPVALRRDDGTEVDLEQSAFYGSGTFGGIDVYTPAAPLEEGATYTFEAAISEDQIHRESDRRTELETTYTVEASDADATLPNPAPPELYTIKTARPAGGSCDSGRHETEVRFGYPSDARSKVGYFVVTFREKPSGESDGATETDIIDRDDFEGETLSVSERLGFEPQCATVEAYSPDRTLHAARESCRRIVCAETSSTYPRRPWSEMPRCGGDSLGDAGHDHPDDRVADGGSGDTAPDDVAPGGGDSGGQTRSDAGPDAEGLPFDSPDGVSDGCSCRQSDGSAPGPGLLPALVFGLLGVIGIRRRKKGG